jgi:hypothetical protein
MTSTLRCSLVATALIVPVAGCAADPSSGAASAPSHQVAVQPIGSKAGEATASHPAREAPKIENESADAPDPNDPDAADLRTIATLEKSMALYQTFLDKAGTDPRYSDAVERTKLRVDDIRATITFLRQGIEERRSKQSVP